MTLIPGPVVDKGVLRNSVAVQTWRRVCVCLWSEIDGGQHWRRHPSQLFFVLSFEDKRGATINSSSNDRGWSAKLTKMSLLRYIFIDEVEAAAVEVLGKVEEEARKNTRRPACFRYPRGKNEDESDQIPRAWGGVNVLLIGDWWQLTPTGGIAVMSNPYSKMVLGCASARVLMASLWCMPTNVQSCAASCGAGDADPFREDNGAVGYRLQRWSSGQRVLQLSTNIRSGKDLWWNEVL